MPGRNNKEDSGQHLAPKSGNKTKPSSGNPAATATTSTRTAAVATGTQPTGNPKPAAASIVKQPSIDWPKTIPEQQCFMLMTAFPCMGKSSSVSCLAGLAGEAGKKWTIYDLDSSEFWPGRSKAGLPYYLCKIIETADKPGAIILVSAHKLLRQALFLLGVKYVSVRPPGGSTTKQLYLAREAKRHRTTKGLYKVMNEQWDAWMENEEKEASRSRSIELKNTEYLSDVIKREVTCELRKEGHQEV